jgi:hypothetical protein
VDCATATATKAGISFAVPAEQGLGLDQEQGATPIGNEPGEQNKQSALVPQKEGALDGARDNDELLPKHRVLGNQLGARATDVGDQATERRPWPVSYSPRPCGAKH